MFPYIVWEKVQLIGFQTNVAISSRDGLVRQKLTHPSPTWPSVPKQMGLIRFWNQLPDIDVELCCPFLQSFCYWMVFQDLWVDNSKHVAPSCRISSNVHILQGLKDLQRLKGVPQGSLDLGSKVHILVGYQARGSRRECVRILRLVKRAAAS
jgi:hypothetical protein